MAVQRVTKIQLQDELSLTVKSLTSLVNFIRRTGEGRTDNFIAKHLTEIIGEIQEVLPASTCNQEGCNGKAVYDGMCADCIQFSEESRLGL